MPKALADRYDVHTSNGNPLPPPASLLAAFGFLTLSQCGGSALSDRANQAASVSVIPGWPPIASIPGMPTPKLARCIIIIAGPP